MNRFLYSRKRDKGSDSFYYSHSINMFADLKLFICQPLFLRYVIIFIYLQQFVISLQ